MKKVLRILLGAFVVVMLFASIGSCSKSESKKDSTEDVVSEDLEKGYSFDMEAEAKKHPFLTSEGVRFAKEHEDDARITDYYEAEKKICDTDWGDVDELEKALGELKSMARNHGLDELEDEVDQYLDRITVNGVIDSEEYDQLGYSFACWMVEGLYAESVEYDYPLDVDMTEYVSICESLGLTMVRKKYYGEVIYFFFDSEREICGRVWLDLKGNVKSIDVNLQIIPSIITVVDGDVFMDQSREKQVEQTAEHTYQALQDISVFETLYDRRLAAVLTENEIQELAFVLHSFTSEKLADMFGNRMEQYVWYIQTDEHMVALRGSTGGITISSIYDKDFFRSTYQASLIRHPSGDFETGEVTGFSSMEEYVESENSKYGGTNGDTIAYYEIADTPLQFDVDMPENDGDIEQNPANNTDSNQEANGSELEQKLFDSINYALSIGATSNCDLDQETLKVLYEKIEDGSFFEESMFSLVNQYGKDRYNYEISYDALVVCIYCVYNYTENLYGYDILEY